ncbi:hypothetical protein KAX75_03250 [candidate division WOR-3 bacterium]|nr:hypothetical protein [candidate division WOR-3 bacterium]
MRKILFILMFVLILASMVFSQYSTKKPCAPWLLDNKKFSMNHSFNFSYGSWDSSLRSLYNNYFTYQISPQLRLIGNIGYYKRDLKANGVADLLHGFGFEYKPSENLFIRFHYEGLTPLKKPVGSD